MEEARRPGACSDRRVARLPPRAPAEGPTAPLAAAAPDGALNPEPGAARAEHAPRGTVARAAAIVGPVAIIVRHRSGATVLLVALSIHERRRLRFGQKKLTWTIFLRFFCHRANGLSQTAAAAAGEFRGLRSRPSGVDRAGALTTRPGLGGSRAVGRESALSRCALKLKCKTKNGIGTRFAPFSSSFFLVSNSCLRPISTPETDGPRAQSQRHRRTPAKQASERGASPRHNDTWRNICSSLLSTVEHQHARGGGDLPFGRARASRMPHLLVLDV